ncbi:hypothetical protein [Pseudalkalibacillus hwajinpoensis]|uniref:DUF4083 domain-containing protein n=1 Tax=Guptibacillus hwajinpoensis TaxID=208199 RepID=A0A4U1MP63_9BACL|nr:hypothetical protein [Pseudalkalibacillus hwajinpoensis]TKD72576.1 hypothetical protein FBF83_07310 [Pseudalkalibacillus hwajinpoensis]
MSNNQGMGMDGFGMMFGLFGILYFAIALFVVVLTIVFMFKAMGYMKRKNAADQEQNELLRQLVSSNTASRMTKNDDPTSY